MFEVLRIFGENLLYISCPKMPDAVWLSILLLELHFCKSEFYLSTYINVINAKRKLRILVFFGEIQ